MTTAFQDSHLLNFLGQTATEIQATFGCRAIQMKKYFNEYFSVQVRFDHLCYSKP